MTLVGLPTQDDALALAWSKVLAMNPRAMAADSGASLTRGGGRLVLRVMDRECSVDLVTKEIVWTGDRPAPVSTYLQVLVLHYLSGAGKTQLANQLVTFRDFEGGAVYYPAFKSRAIDPIAKEFGSRPEILKHIGEVMRAEPMKAGTVGMKVYFFPKLPVVITLWVGDEEVPASANMVFDASAGKILPTEDLSVLASALARRLVEISKR